MSDPDRNAETEPSDSPDSEVSSDRGADVGTLVSAPEVEARVHAQFRPNEPPSSGARKRSSIRPAPADWRPSARAVSNPPRPMVVVYSGERERPERWWDESSANGYSQALDEDTPAPPDPALSARELRVPSAAHVAASASSAAEGAAPCVDPFSTMIPPAGSTSDVSESAAPVALSSADSFLPMSARGIPLRSISMPPADLVLEEQVRARRERASTVRRAAVVVVGAFLSAYFVTQRVALRKNESAPRVAEKTTEALAEPASPARTELTVRASAPNDPTPEEVPPNGADAPIGPPRAEAEAEGKASALSPPEAPPGKKTVLIEVVPWDAKVVLAGVAQPGPPFIVTIPEGKRIAFEVARKGYIPRRVVVDGSESKLSVGLVRPRGARGDVPPSAPSRAAEAGSEDGNKDSRVRVRSGL